LPPISPPLFLNLSFPLGSFFSFLSLFVLELEPLSRFSEPDEVETEDTEAEAVGSDELVRFNNLKLYLFDCVDSSLKDSRVRLRGGVGQPMTRLLEL